MNSDYSAVNASIFAFNPASRVFTIESHDIEQIDTYNLKVTAKYTGEKYTMIGELPFIVTVNDPCANASLTIDPAILTTSPVSYKIGYEADVQTFTQNKITSTESVCPTYVFSFGGKPEPSVFTFDSMNSMLTTSSAILLQAGTYRLRL